MKSSTNPYSLQCSPGVPPRLNWTNLAPVDWSGLPPLANRVAELNRFVTKWRDESLSRGLYYEPPAIPKLDCHASSRKALKQMRKTCGLPLKEFRDWRGISRDAEDALAEFYILARRYCMKMRGTGAPVPQVGSGFFPNVKQNGYPQRELERAADFMGSRVAYRTPKRIGPKAKPWAGLTEDDFRWLESQYPGDYWKTQWDTKFMRWHLNNRAEWSYKVASVQIRRSQIKEKPAPSFSMWLYNEWVRNDFNANRKQPTIDLPIDQAMLDEHSRIDDSFDQARIDEQIRLDEAFEANQL